MIVYKVKCDLCQRDSSQAFSRDIPLNHARGHLASLGWRFEWSDGRVQTVVQDQCPTCK